MHASGPPQGVSAEATSIPALSAPPCNTFPMKAKISVSAPSETAATVSSYPAPAEPSP
jgi:hypothetical protein